MSQHSHKTNLWLDILTTSVLPGFTALIGMLALEYLVTGSFDAAEVYLLIALAITSGLVTLHWYRARSHRHHPVDHLSPTSHPNKS